jgi:hypothetical protein
LGKKKFLNVENVLFFKFVKEVFEMKKDVKKFLDEIENEKKKNLNLNEKKKQAPPVFSKNAMLNELLNKNKKK